MKFTLSANLLFLFLLFVHLSHSGRVQNQRVRRPTTTTSTTEPTLVNEAEEDEDGQDEEPSNVPTKNKQLDVRNSTKSYQTATISSENNEPECSPPSINDFPDDIFTQTQRRFGFIIFHIAFAVYLFVAILKVCDDYFLGSLEIIAQKLNLDQDVAGATFMAIGSSAPEVFISLVSIFVSGASPGIGSIVGSAVFNILFVMGICSLLVVNSAKLTFWPFLRDSIFYFISIFLLALLINDSEVKWYESGLLIGLYCLYVALMMNNNRVKDWVYAKFHMVQQESMNVLSDGLPVNKMHGVLGKRTMSQSQSGYNRFNDEDEMNAWSGTMDNINVHQDFTQSYQNQGNPYAKNALNTTILNADASVTSSTRQIEFDTAAFHIMMDKRYFSPRTRFQMAVRRVIDEIQWLKKCEAAHQSQNAHQFSNLNMNPLNVENYKFILADKPNVNEPLGTYNFIKWLVFIPARILFYYTMPDCRIEKYKKYYVVTFVLSIFWFAILSYLIVWMITVIGFTLGIPDSLMSVTFIAAGTSIPDAYTSVVVVKEGMVDMGVSNIIGSNVFDLLIGLAFPWFVKSLFNQGTVKINSNGLKYDAFLLLACVIVTVAVIHLRRWQLDKRSGYIFLSVYAAFLIFSSAIELNVFSYVNPPMCA